MTAPMMDTMWYNVSEYIHGHTKKEPTAEEWVHYLHQLGVKHLKQVEALEAELKDFRTLKAIIQRM